MKHNSPAKVREWLQTMPTLEELCAEYPGEWDAVQRELSSIFECGKPEDLKAYLECSPTRGTSIARTLHSSQGDRKKSEAALLQFIRNRMAYLVLKNYSLAAATGVTKGKVRFNLLNGYIVQKLLFSRKLERKPVSLFWFRLIWPLIWQKRLLMAAWYCLRNWMPQCISSGENPIKRKPPTGSAFRHIKRSPVCSMDSILILPNKSCIFQHHH